MTNSSTPILQPQSSPLAEAQGNSLDKYFSMDPMAMGKQDRMVIVEGLRKQRAQWKQAEAEGKTKAPKAKAAAGPRPKATGLDDLGL